MRILPECASLPVTMFSKGDRATGGLSARANPRKTSRRGQKHIGNHADQRHRALLDADYWILPRPRADKPPVAPKIARGTENRPWRRKSPCGNVVFMASHRK